MDADSPNLQWQRRYEESDTPWDKGAPAPALGTFLRKEPIAGRVLVPGCGRGHEVRLLGAQPGVSVVGLDLSDTAIAQAKALGSTAGISSEISFVAGDFFDLPSEWKGSFDWIVEHTCFCAIEPRQRPHYLSAATVALRGGGKFFAIFYLTPDVDAGPPFAVSREELSALFDPHFALLDEWVPRESFPGREGRELVRMMEKR
jgi:cyclopropane fatty-acyl-phospholipid synthase-like methyltransferase